MGRIKTKLIKSIAKRLVKAHGTELSVDFSKNKEFVSKYTTVSSMKMRNVIAGYTARLMKQSASDKGPRRRASEEDLSKFYQ